MFQLIFSKLYTLLMYILGISIICFCLAFVYCWIFKISYNRFIATVFIPFISLIISMGYVIYQLFYLPIVIFNGIKVIVLKIIDMIYFTINFINNVSSFLYDTTDSLFY
jgi:hypothetical protein